MPAFPQKLPGGGGGGYGGVGSGGGGGGGSEGDETNRSRGRLLGRELGTFSGGAMATGKSGTGGATSSWSVDRQRSDRGRNGSDGDHRGYYNDHGHGDRQLALQSRSRLLRWQQQQQQQQKHRRRRWWWQSA